jgi:hypothetical protein
MASVSRLPNPPTNGFILIGNNDFIYFIIFAFTFAACFKSYFLIA